MEKRLKKAEDLLRRIHNKDFAFYDEFRKSVKDYFIEEKPTLPRYKLLKPFLGFKLATKYRFENCMFEVTYYRIVATENAHLVRLKEVSAITNYFKIEDKIQIEV